MTSTQTEPGKRSPQFIIRAARSNGNFIDAEIREYQRREEELRQQTLVAAAAARLSNSPDNVKANSALAAANSVPIRKEDGKQGPTTSSTRNVVCRRSTSVEHRQTKMMTSMMKRWASLRLHRELLYERQRELELLQHGRIDTTSDQRRITLT